MIGDIPAWLPDIVSVEGTWEDVLSRLYVIFERDIKNGKPRLNGCLVWHDRRREDGDKYEEGFWHLIQRENRVMAERQFDPRRAERLPWCKPTIENTGDSAVLMWDFEESGGQVNTYIWLVHYDYVIILVRFATKKFGNVYKIITAYHIDGDSTRRKFQRKYDSRVQK